MNFWNTILETNTFNFAILLIILAVLFRFLRISNLLESLKQQIITSVENSKKEKENAQLALSNAEKLAETLKDELKSRESDTIQKAKAIETQIISSAENQIKYIEKNTDNAVWAEEKIITAKIEKDTFDKASALAKKQIIQMLKNNPELHNKFIKESIEVI